MLRFLTSSRRPAFWNPEKIKGKKGCINEQSYSNETNNKGGLAKLFTKDLIEKK